MTDQPSRQFEPSDLNPLLYGSPEDVLDEVSSVLQFLGRVHSDLADGHFHAENHGAIPPDEMTYREHRGFVMLLRVADAAVRYAAGSLPQKGGES